MTDTTDDLLKVRHTTHGEFTTNARVEIAITRVLESGDRADDLTDEMRVALRMIAHKEARIVDGDPFFAEHWDDVAGYARLVAERLRDGRVKPETSSMADVYTVMAEHWKIPRHEAKALLIKDLYQSYVPKLRDALASDAAALGDLTAGEMHALMEMRAAGVGDLTTAELHAITELRAGATFAPRLSPAQEQMRRDMLTPDTLADGTIVRIRTGVSEAVGRIVGHDVRTYEGRPEVWYRIRVDAKIGGSFTEYTRTREFITVGDSPGTPEDGGHHADDKRRRPYVVEVGTRYTTLAGSLVRGGPMDGRPWTDLYAQQEDGSLRMIDAFREEYGHP